MRFLKYLFSTDHKVIGLPGAVHGTIMVFLGAVPLAVGAFGNYLVPPQIWRGRRLY